MLTIVELICHLILLRWVHQGADTQDWVRRDHSTASPASAVLLKNIGTGALQIESDIKFGIQSSMKYTRVSAAFGR